MEYLEGETLSDRLAKGPLSIELTLRFGTEIADALEKAHRHGIVHRDLKPGNVMLNKSGVKLLDFGLAKMARPKEPSGLTGLPCRSDSAGIGACGCSGREAWARSSSLNPTTIVLNWNADPARYPPRADLTGAGPPPKPPTLVGLANDTR